MSAIVLRLDPRNRLTLTTTIERLINLLDAMEPDADAEPSIGWTGHGTGWNGETLDDREDGDDNGIADFEGVAEQWPNWRDVAI